MTYRHWYEERMVQPRYSSKFGGVDHGTSGNILVEVREGNSVKYRLIWFKGHSHAACGIRGFGQEYSPARMTITEGGGYWVKSLLQGGRLTKKRILDQAKDIDKILGNDVTLLIDTNKTLIVAY